jgi:proton-translocating NAD(P)+ transhydrogenase subunit alpha
MIAGVPKETFPGERRVAMVPATLSALTKSGVEVLLESGAGEAASYPDEAYREKGARIGPRSQVLETADVLLTVRSFGRSPLAPPPDLAGLRRGQVVIGFLESIGSPEGMRALAERGVTAFALELVPRTTRAQSMDALSSAATVVGYKAALLAADTLPRMFPMFMTAAGTLTAAKAFVVGAGVAGLQAIAATRRLGAVVQAYDVRPAVREQVQSLGARFVELPLEAGSAQDERGYARVMDDAFYKRQREMMAQVVAQSDVVITTAAVPGKKAPVLITADMVEGMKPGSVVVDVAAEQGGNCELTKVGETVVRNGVTVIGPVNLAAAVPQHASQMHARNVASFLALLVADGRLKIDTADDIVRETLVTREGEVVHPRVREALGLPAPTAATSG